MEVLSVSLADVIVLGIIGIAILALVWLSKQAEKD
jgi:hypothetical protein